MSYTTNINTMINTINNITDYIDDINNNIQIRFINGEIIETNKQNTLMILFTYLPDIIKISWEGPNFRKQARFMIGFDVENDDLFNHFQIEYNYSSLYMIILNIEDIQPNTNNGSYWRSHRICKVVKIT